jgi:hypothetical protein
MASEQYGFRRTAGTLTLLLLLLLVASDRALAQSPLGATQEPTSNALSVDLSHGPAGSVEPHPADQP